MRFGPKEVDGGERAPQEDSTVQKEALSGEGAQLRNRKGKWGQAVMNCGAVAGQPWAEGMTGSLQGWGFPVKIQ